MEEGTVNLYIKVKDTCEKLYDKAFTANNNGEALQLI